MQQSLERDPSGYELRADPTALAPESLLVFEVRGPIQSFANAVRKIDGMDYVGEEDLPEDDDDKEPKAYLMVPDLQALREIESLWRHWQRGEELERGQKAWRDVFNLLRDIRRWGPEDRIEDTDADILAELIEDRDDNDRLRLEIELVFRPGDADARDAEAALAEQVALHGGEIIARSRLEHIVWHALLVELPVVAVRAIIKRSADSIAGLGPVMHIRPQSLASGLDIADPMPVENVAQGAISDQPILALLDGVPISEHPLLQDRLSVLDHFGLEPETSADRREHGTAMASLIVRGDGNKTDEQPLPRRILVVPVIGGQYLRETFPDDRLAVDMIHEAVLQIRRSDEIADILIINLSLGNLHRPFHGVPSAWARLLDYLSWQYGLLFIVSAGNVDARFRVPGFQGRIDFEDAEPTPRSEAVIRGIDDIKAERRLLSPAESLNALTVGAANISWTPQGDRQLARTVIDPHTDIVMANPSSALGPGIGNAVKPDILIAGGREHLRTITGGDILHAESVRGQRATGLKVAAPPAGADYKAGYTLGTSAAAALASRTAHRIHDALEAEYGAQFLSLDRRQKAALLKALVAHPAIWPGDTTERIKGVVGPADNRKHVRQKDNIRRFLGYGIVDCDDAVACAADRATFWATGLIGANRTVDIDIPVPQIIGFNFGEISFFATLAWISPVRPGRLSYRNLKLEIARQASVLSVNNVRTQPDQNQSKRGTLMTRRWQSRRDTVIVENAWERISVTRLPDQGEQLDEDAAFGLAVTLAVPGEVQLYDQVRTMVRQRQAARVGV